MFSLSHNPFWRWHILTNSFHIYIIFYQRKYFPYSCHLIINNVFSTSLMTHKCFKLPFPLVGTTDQRRGLLCGRSIILLVLQRAWKTFTKGRGCAVSVFVYACDGCHFQAYTVCVCVCPVLCPYNSTNQFQKTDSWSLLYTWKMSLKWIQPLNWVKWRDFSCESLCYPLKHSVHFSSKHQLIKPCGLKR